MQVTTRLPVHPRAQRSQSTEPILSGSRRPDSRRVTVELQAVCSRMHVRAMYSLDPSDTSSRTIDCNGPRERLAGDRGTTIVCDRPPIARRRIRWVPRGDITPECAHRAGPHSQRGECPSPLTDVISDSVHGVPHHVWRPVTAETPAVDRLEGATGVGVPSACVRIALITPATGLISSPPDRSGRPIRGVSRAVRPDYSLRLFQSVVMSVSSFVSPPIAHSIVPP